MSLNIWNMMDFGTSQWKNRKFPDSTPDFMIINEWPKDKIYLIHKLYVSMASTLLSPTTDRVYIFRNDHDGRQTREEMNGLFLPIEFFQWFDLFFHLLYFYRSQGNFQNWIWIHFPEILNHLNDFDLVLVREYNLICAIKYGANVYGKYYIDIPLWKQLLHGNQQD